jgi:hypothetical protein
VTFKQKHFESTLSFNVEANVTLLGFFLGFFSSNVGFGSTGTSECKCSSAIVTNFLPFQIFLSSWPLSVCRRQGRAFCFSRAPDSSSVHAVSKAVANCPDAWYESS